MPWISLLTFNISDTGPFLASGILSFFSFIAAYKIPKDTISSNLDTYVEMRELKELKAHSPED